MGNINKPAMVDLYVKRTKIHPKAVSGFFQTIRKLTMAAALLWFFAAPWLTWNGRQAILFDLSERKFYLFDITFWPQDFFLLTWLLIIGALALFFFTALAGRLWCGYTCPQTVWTKWFMKVEQMVEGERNQRLKLDKAPWSVSKFFKRLTKHTIWMLIAFVTAFTFVGFFIPVPQLVWDLLHLNMTAAGTGWLVFFTLATYINAGWMREQVCIYMCPYARFQGVMFDKNTWVISYDAERGEPRGSRPKQTDPKAAGLGDCIDCKQCVQVCPTGIDIREGLQIACIGCAACIDACDSVMDKMHYPRGLVRYTTDNQLNHRPTHIVRPRLVIYGLLLTVLTVGFLYTVATRPLVGLDVLRDRNILYRETEDGQIENVYTLKIRNLTQGPVTYTIAVKSDYPTHLEGDSEVELQSGEIITQPVRVSIPLASLNRLSVVDVQFIVSHNQEKRLTIQKGSHFLAP